MNPISTILLLVSVVDVCVAVVVVVVVGEKKEKKPIAMNRPPIANNTITKTATIEFVHYSILLLPR